MGFSFKDALPAIGAAVGLPFVGSSMLAGGSSALDYLSAQKQNESAEDMSKMSMHFSGLQAQKQMDFQERMSGTSHQREVEDLKAAGLNPLLSANAGASSPAGSAGTGAQAPVVPELSAITSSARDAIGLYSSYKSSMAQADAAKASAVASRASAGKTGIESDMLRKKGPEADIEYKFYNFINGLLDRFGRSSAKQGVRNFRNSGFGDFSHPYGEYKTDEDTRIRLQYAPGR